MIPFGEFAPDQSDQNTGVSTVADNCIAGASSYIPLRGPDTDAATALAGECFGASYVTTLGGSYAFAASSFGATAELYLGSLDITNLSLTGSLNNPPAYFVPYGDTVYIFGAYITPQSITDAVLASPTILTSDMAGSPPKAKIAAIIRNFLVIGHTFDDVDEFKSRVQWSGFDDPTEWTVGTNQSGFQDIQGNGADIEAIVGGEYGVIFQRNAIVRMTYVGAPLIWQFDAIEEEIGVFAGESVVQVGSDIYYLGNNGFHVLKDGVTSIPIGLNKIDRWFFSELHPSAPTSSSSFVVGAYDSITGSVIWSFRDKTSTVKNRLIIYNIKSQKWTTATINLEWIYSTPPLTGIGTPTELRENAVEYFDSEHKPRSPKGDYLAATIETGEISQDDRLTQLTSVRPVIDGTSTVIVSTRDKLTDTATDSASISLDGSGKANTRTHARYHRIKVTTSGDFNHATGVEVDIKPRGKR